MPIPIENFTADDGTLKVVATGAREDGLAA